MVKKTDKKAWLKILEVFLAVLLIMGAVLIIISNNKEKTDIGKIVYEKQKYILDVISKNESLRNDVIAGRSERIDATILKMVPGTWNFTTKVCLIDEICNANTPNDKEIYVSEVIVTSNLTKYEPKKLRFFVWMEQRPRFTITDLVCGNAECDSSSGENCLNCPEDCGECPASCGNENCNEGAGENCFTCPQDCGPCPPGCSDGTCNPDIGENCDTCPEDCGACPESCGNENCNEGAGENCFTCPQDCGPCPP